jgi:hypothetical protein
MKANTILSLYNGEYTCIEKPTSKDRRYTDNLSKCIATEEKLEKILDSETYSLVEKLLEYHSLMSIVELEDTFVEGFSLGVSLLLEALSKK